jgi:hypothetical protein
VRTLPCGGCGASLRSDDRHLSVPEAGDFTDGVRPLDAPWVAERPHRVAHDRLQRCTGVALRSRGAQGSIDSTADMASHVDALDDTPAVTLASPMLEADVVAAR